jgi:hypothetical protein
VDKNKGTKRMAKTSKKPRLRDDIARIVADIHGVSVSYVQKVRSGERQNEQIEATLVRYRIGQNNLIKKLEQMIPLTPQPDKYARQKN